MFEGMTAAGRGVFRGAGVCGGAISGAPVGIGVCVDVGVRVSVGVATAVGAAAGGSVSSANRGHTIDSSKALMPFPTAVRSRVTDHKNTAAPTSLSHRGLPLVGPPQKTIINNPSSVWSHRNLPPPAPGKGPLPPVLGGGGGAGGVVGGCDGDAGGMVGG